MYDFKKCLELKDILHAPEEKEVIILIHGFPASSFDYHRALQFLEASGHPVLLFDHVGFGFSDKPKEVGTAEIANGRWVQCDQMSL
jgi:pimeloyl-ACP methyl ester carboxylesterase